MKKLLSIILVAFMVVALLSVSAFARNNVPTDFLLITSGESYNISSGDYTISKIRVGGSATLTIEKNAKVTVNDFSNTSGTVNVFGTLVITQDTFDNRGTINVGCGGTITINGTNRYRDGEIIYSEHTWKDGICTVCNAACSHTWNNDTGVCSVCGVKGCAIGELSHTWEDGICTVCNAACSHTWNNDTGVCSVCGVKGCTIGELNHTWKDGICTVCNAACSHVWNDATGICSICNYQCPHEGYICLTCGKELYFQGNGLAGSAISGGNIAIITAIAGVVIGMAMMFVIMKKKESHTYEQH